jgi:hypothetical protein
VFGLSDTVDPCELDDGAFDTAEPVDLGAAEDFSIAVDRDLAVVQVDGLIFEVRLGGGDPVPIFLGDYPAYAFGFAPEGDALFYSAPVEPIELLGAARGADGAWRLGRTVPKATFAGAPSADAYGPRRVIVRVRATDTAVRELEDVAGVWTPIGEPFEIGEGPFAPNLTPSALAMVWSTETAVLAATRATPDAPFAAPRTILSRRARAPQLAADRCQTLYASELARLVRSDR